MPVIEDIRWSRFEDEDTVDSLYDILEAPETIRPVALPQPEPTPPPSPSDGFRSVVSAGLFFGLVVGVGLRVLLGGHDVATAAAMTGQVVHLSSRAVAATPPSVTVDEPRDAQVRPPDAVPADQATAVDGDEEDDEPAEIRRPRHGPRRAATPARRRPEPASTTEAVADADEVYGELDELSDARAERERQGKQQVHRPDERGRASTSADRPREVVR